MRWRSVRRCGNSVRTGAAMPLAALCWDGGVAAAAVEPYSESEAGIIRNGVFAALPDAFGISLGYTNDPTTFKNRSTPAPSTRSMACKAQTNGRIYLHSGPRTELHEIIRREYARPPGPRRPPQYPAPGRAGYAGHLCLPEL